MTTLLGISRLPREPRAVARLPRHARLGALQLRRPQLRPGDRRSACAWTTARAASSPASRRRPRSSTSTSTRPRSARTCAWTCRSWATSARVLSQARARDPARGAAEPRGLARPDRRLARAVPAQAATPTTRPSCTSRRSSRRIYRATRGEAVIVADVGQHQMFAAQHYLYDAAVHVHHLGRPGHDGLLAAGGDRRPDGAARQAGLVRGRRRLLPDDAAGAGGARRPPRAGQDRAAQQRVPGHGPPAAAGAVPAATWSRSTWRARPTTSSWPRPTAFRPGG